MIFEIIYLLYKFMQPSPKMLDFLHFAKIISPHSIFYEFFRKFNFCCHLVNACWTKLMMASKMQCKMIILKNELKCSELGKSVFFKLAFRWSIWACFWTSKIVDHANKIFCLSAWFREALRMHLDAHREPELTFLHHRLDFEAAVSYAYWLIYRIRSERYIL